MCVDSIRKIISFSKTIRDRRWCTEQDVVYHFVAPLLECLGYSKEELYFEWGEGSPIPDITVIPDNYDHPLLTVEVKKPDHALASPQVNGVYKFERSHTTHDDVIQQVFCQLKIPRQTDYSYALLVNRVNVALFTLLKCDCESKYDHMYCIYESSFNEILNDDDKIKLLANHLHRDAIIGKNNYLINKIRSLDRLEIIQSQPTLIQNRRASIQLPDDWDNQFRSWSNVFSPMSNSENFNVFKSLVDRHSMTLEEKMSLFEIMRFCHLMQNRMPDDWELRFSVGAIRNGGNVFVQLYPKFSTTELQKKAFFLYKITATKGNLLGSIWFNIKKKMDFDTDNPRRILNDIKSKMATPFHNSVHIYEERMVEDLIETTSNAASEMFDKGLTSNKFKN